MRGVRTESLPAFNIQFSIRIRIQIKNNTGGAIRTRWYMYVNMCSLESGAGAVLAT